MKFDRSFYGRIIAACATLLATIAIGFTLMQPAHAQNPGDEDETACVAVQVNAGKLYMLILNAQPGDDVSHVFEAIVRNDEGLPEADVYTLAAAMEALVESYPNLPNPQEYINAVQQYCEATQTALQRGRT